MSTGSAKLPMTRASRKSAAVYKKISDPRADEIHHALDPRQCVHIEGVHDRVKSFFSIPDDASHDSFSASDDLLPIQRVVDPETLEGLGKQEIARQNILLEFANSERKQSYNLKLLKDVFGPIINDETNFYRLDCMMYFHFQFYLDLMRCMRGEDVLFGDVGNVVINVFSNRSYINTLLKYQSYICSKDLQGKSTMQAVENLEQQNRNILNKRSLKDLIVSEIQRATKYKLLLERLIKYSPETDIEAVSRALEIAVDTTKQIDSENFLQQMKLMTRNFDRTAVDADKSPENEVLRNFDFVHNDLELYGYYEGEMRMMQQKKSKSTLGDESPGTNQRAHKTKSFIVRAPLKCHFFLYSTHLVMVTEEKEKPVLKPFLYQGVPAILDLKNIIKVTPDITSVRSKEESKKPALVICSDVFLLHVFFESVDELYRWEQAFEDLSGSGKPPKLKHRELRYSVSAPAGSPQITPENFNFQDRILNQDTPDSETCSTYSEDENNEPIRSKQECLERIDEIREEIKNVINEMFDLGRKIYDPTDSRTQESERLTFNHVVTEDLAVLVDPSLWMAGARGESIKSFPVISIDGSLSAEDCVKVPNVEYFFNENASMHLEADLAANEQSSTATSSGFVVFSDGSGQRNEVHLTAGAGEFNRRVRRMEHKAHILHHHLHLPETSSSEDETAGGQ